jgi:uncharacterized protein (TIGR02118 family)
MFKISVYYPYQEGARFDIDYYCNNHMPMVQNMLGDACKGIAVDHGIGGGAPDEKPMFCAIGHILVESLEDFQKAIAENQEKLGADLTNYTTIPPQIQINEIKL